MSDELIDFLMGSSQFDEPFKDILTIDPNLTIDDAYRLQFEIMRRRVATGDRIVGYKAAGTSVGAQDVIGEKTDILVGTLLSSHLREDGASFDIRKGATFVEAEIAVLLGRDLSGPSATLLDAAAATAGVFAGIEVAPWSPAVVAKKRSHQHALATLKADGVIILSPKLVSIKDLDLRTEGAFMDVDGKVTESGTAVNVLGNPLNVVAAIANFLSRFDAKLHSGMIIMTGSILTPHSITRDEIGEPKQHRIRVTYSTLGSLGVTLNQR